jgi:hypothetical protein
MKNKKKIMINTHLIAGKTATPIYTDPTADGSPVTSIPKGSWLGVIERKLDWIKVIGTQIEGWVRKNDVEELPPMKLHAVWNPGKPIEYVMRSGAC